MKAPQQIAGALLLLQALGVQTAGANHYLYSPAKATVAQIRDKSADQVAVTEVKVAKGDTLKRISRRFSGRSSYFPQILLFNRIANPDLIHPGQVFRVPMAPDLISAGTLEPATGKAPLAAPSPSVPTSEPADGPAIARPGSDKKTAEAKAPTVSAQPTNSAAQSLYAKGVRAYKSGKCRQAIAAFDRFLARFPDSPLAADASLYRADCYLKLAERQGQ